MWCMLLRNNISHIQLKKLLRLHHGQSPRDPLTLHAEAHPAASRDRERAFPCQKKRKKLHLLDYSRTKTLLQTMKNCRDHNQG